MCEKTARGYGKKIYVTKILYGKKQCKYITKKFCGVNHKLSKNSTSAKKAKNIKKHHQNQKITPPSTLQQSSQIASKSRKFLESRSDQN
jgi:hypothetical protein